MTTFVAAGNPGFENPDDWNIKEAKLELFQCPRSNPKLDTIRACAYGRRSKMSACLGK